MNNYMQIIADSESELKERIDDLEKEGWIRYGEINKIYSHNEKKYTYNQMTRHVDNIGEEFDEKGELTSIGTVEIFNNTN